MFYGYYRQSIQYSKFYCRFNKAQYGSVRHIWAYFFVIILLLSCFSGCQVGKRPVDFTVGFHEIGFLAKGLSLIELKCVLLLRYSMSIVCLFPLIFKLFLAAESLYL